ncbi:MAG: hypothetical protein PHX34_05525 [Candidatus Shapirobacteria bacterium]|nr:hypothetical protein [Candidatus Shapirobacteria bacterium]
MKGYQEIKSFTKLINSYLSKKRKSNEIENVIDGLEIFLYKFPKDLREYTLSKINNYQVLKEAITNYKSPFLQKEPISSNKKIIKIIKKMISSLNKEKKVIIFILHDCAIIQECFKILNYKKTPNFSIRISRKDLKYPKEESLKKYLYLFSKINQISHQNKNLNWNSFLQKYNSIISNDKKINDKLKHFYSSTLKNINNTIPNSIFKKQFSFTIIDTGLQGTFAIFLCWLLKKYKKVKKVDFSLLACYPWLPKIFQKRSFLKKIKSFPIIENSIINKHSKSLPFFGRVIYKSRYKIEKEKIKKLLYE